MRVLCKDRPLGGPGPHEGLRSLLHYRGVAIARCPRAVVLSARVELGLEWDQHRPMKAFGR
jgi:hypothetical protein